MKGIKVLTVSLFMALALLSVNAQEKPNNECNECNKKEFRIRENKRPNRDKREFFKDLSPETISMIRIDLMSKKIDLTKSQKKDLKNLFIKNEEKKKKALNEKKEFSKKFMEKMHESREKEMKEITDIIGEENAKILKDCKCNKMGKNMNCKMKCSKKMPKRNRIEKRNNF